MISAILATSMNNIIGKNRALPWPHIREDMKWFKNKTEHSVVVMGRTTWESLGKYAPLSNRINVVVSSSNIHGADATITKNVIENIQALEIEYPHKEIFIIGGALLYHSTNHILDKVYLTKIMKEFDGDTSIDINTLLENTTIDSSEYLQARDHDFNISFTVYRKTK